jgi:hypothetical protein
MDGIHDINSLFNHDKPRARWVIAGKYGGEYGAACQFSSRVTRNGGMTIPPKQPPPNR